MEKYRNGKKQFFDSIEVNVTSNDICTLLGNKNIDVDAAGITTLFRVY